MVGIFKVIAYNICNMLPGVKVEGTQEDPVPLPLMEVKKRPNK